MQVVRMRHALESVRQSQVVYIEVEHWTDFPHVPWGVLEEGDRALLDKHFRRCNGAAPYITGQKRLPPRIPSSGAYA
jgi:hypothetical protein